MMIKGCLLSNAVIVKHLKAENFKVRLITYRHPFPLEFHNYIAWEN